MKRIPLFVLSALIFFCVPNVWAAGKITVTEPQTGLTVQAPAGFTLSYSSSGAYTLTNNKIYARFILARSPFNLKQTATSFLKLTKAKVLSTSVKSTKITYQATVAGKKVTVVLTKVGSFIDVVTYGKGSAIKRDAKLTDRALDGLSAKDIATLQQALNTRHGGTSAPLQLAIPTKLFRAADGTTAIVPNLPGWSYTGGGGGIISGSNATQGVFELGVPAIAGYLGGPIVSPFVSAGQAIASVWPQYTSSYLGVQIQVDGIQEVPGTDGFLAPDYYSSGQFGIHFILNGQGWQGLMTSGTTPTPGAEQISFIWYHSFIAVPDNGPGGVGPALLNTWATWNHTAADNKRLAQAIQTLQSIRVPGGPIDPDVFEAAANAWDGYIRE